MVWHVMSGTPLGADAELQDVQLPILLERSRLINHAWCRHKYMACVGVQSKVRNVFDGCAGECWHAHIHSWQAGIAVAAVRRTLHVTRSRTCRTTQHATPA